VAAVLLALTLVSAPVWAPRLLARLAWFQVREIVVDGLRYLPADTVVRLLALRPAASLWDDLAPLAPRVAAHPAIAAADVSREWPARLRIRVVERAPVALAPARRGAVPGSRPLVALDAAGEELPIEPRRSAVDAPVLAVADTALLRLLETLRVEAPRLYRQVSAAHRLADGGVALTLDGVTVLAPREVPVARWLDIFPVLDDLARRGTRAREIDLRFAGQVVARLAP
jgi:cell division protein FtsQ